MKPLTPAERQALEDVSDGLGVKPRHLWSLIAFESGWDPKIKNPTSSARGLIQFMNTTAKMMGFNGGSANLIIAYPTREGQLRGPVFDYLKQWMPYDTEQSLYLAVFYPRLRRAGLDTAFPKWVQEANPGIITVRDYVEHVRSRAGAYPDAED